MTYSKKLYFKSLFISLSIFSVFILAFCFYYENEVTKVEEKSENIPYYSEPQTVGIIIKYDEKLTFLGLDFGENKAVFITNDAVFKALQIGYTIDYSYTFSQEKLEKLVDYLGGIEMNINGENLNLTGNQVSDWFGSDSGEEKLRVLAENISKKIGEVGISESHFEELLADNSGSLTLKSGYLFFDYLKEVFKNLYFIE